MRLQHTRTIGGKGKGPHEFQARLAGVAVDTEDRLWVVGDRELKRFSAQGEFERRFATDDAGWSIAIDDDGIWVGMQGRIDRLDFAGKRQSSIEDQQRLGLITGLAASGDKLLAADATNRTIHLFEQGKWRREVGQEANTRGFMLPNGVLDLALDAESQTVVVAHPQKHRVERYSLQGELTDKFGRFGMQEPGDFGGCCNPTNITTAPGGLVVTSEKAPPRVKLYTPEGEFLAEIGEGLFDPNTKNIDLAADGLGRLYATDPLRCVVEVFELVADENQGDSP